MLSLPLSLRLLCASVLLLNTPAGAQQCRLSTNINTGNNSGGTGTVNPASTPSGAAINGSPSPTPFNYGTDMIRGVNL